MAQQRNQTDELKFSCSICLDLLKDPVTIPCGHNYCMSCIKSCWDEEDKKKIYSCPQCRQTFAPRPVLVKNTMLAELVEELKKTGPKAAPADHDDSPPFKKHKLVEPSVKLQDTICSRHDEVMKIFCRTDQQCICIVCSMDEHKGHNTVSAATERAERQKELGESRLKLQQRIQDREKDVKVLQQEMETVNRSADKAVEDSEKVFTELIRVIEERSSDVKQQIRSWQKTEVSRDKELQDKLNKEIAALKKKDAELEQISRTEDHTQFLHNYSSLSQLTESTEPPRPKINCLQYFGDLMAAMTEARDKMQAILSEKLSLAEPTTRAEFLQYSRQITLDPNTANNFLVLSEGNRKITFNNKNPQYSQHPDRFIHITQVLSQEGLTGRCYWEVEMSRNVGVAVAYKSIGRSGDFNAQVFGYNKKSWLLYCGSSNIFRHDKDTTDISGPHSSRIGVYLDHSAGILSFYSVSESMTLLHRVQTTFTEPLYAGLFLAGSNGDTAEFCKLK
ncbi:tripartite motif-containing protein 16-like [Symphorus nematophorus]